MKLSPVITSLLLAVGVLTCVAPAHAASSTTLSGLPNYFVGEVPAARVNTLTITLEPESGPLRGPRGTTVGWGFKIEWASNAGDTIVFTGSRLVGDASALTTGYVDYIGILSGKTNGFTAAGETWERAFVANRGGLGAVPIRSTSLPGSGYVGKLAISFNVYDSRGPSLGNTLGSFQMLLDVAVVVDPEPPADQTITFETITNKTYGGAPFTVSATASSGLPVTLTSLNPEVCTIQGNTVTIVRAGECTLLAAQDGDTQYNPAPLVSQTFTVAKAPATVAISGALTQIYDGSPKSVSGTPTPSNLNVKLLYSGDPTPPTAAGIYYVQALIDDANYTGSTSAEFLIVTAIAPPLTTYANWRSTAFPTEAQGNPAIVGGTADPDSDGMPNNFEYAMGFDPLRALTASEISALPRLNTTSTEWTLSFSIPEQAASDVVFVVEASPDLSAGSWVEVARRTGNGPWTGTATVVVGTPQNSRVPIQITEAGPSTGKRFYRLGALVQ